MLSSVESKKVSGQHYNIEDSILTTVVFPEAGGPSTQILGAMKQEYVNVKMQNSKNPNQFLTIALHNINVITMKQLFPLEICLNRDLRIGLHWGKKGGTLSQCQLGLPLISMVNEIINLTKHAI